MVLTGFLRYTQDRLTTNGFPFCYAEFVVNKKPFVDESRRVGIEP